MKELKVGETEMDCDFVLKKRSKVIAEQETADLQSMLCTIDAVITKERGN